MSEVHSIERAALLAAEAENRKLLAEVARLEKQLAEYESPLPEHAYTIRYTWDNADYSTVIMATSDSDAADLFLVKTGAQGLKASVNEVTRHFINIS